MRLKKFLNEYKVVKNYAGRDVGRMYEGGVTVWYYMTVPIKKGLIWTLPNGDTYLNKTKLGTINYPNKKLTHKKQLAEFYNKLGFGKEMSGDLRQDVEDMNEMNVRGRIVEDQIYVYPSGDMPQNQYNKNLDKAINAVYKYIPEDMSEKYAFMAHGRNKKPFDVFVNPSKKEMMELVAGQDEKKIRFTAVNDKKKVYVFSAWLGIHQNVAKKVPDYEPWDETSNVLEGEAELKGGKFVMANSDQIITQLMMVQPEDLKLVKELVNNNWTWLNRYIDTTKYLNTMKKEIKKYET